MHSHTPRWEGIQLAIDILERGDHPAESLQHNSCLERRRWLWKHTDERTKVGAVVSDKLV